MILMNQENVCLHQHEHKMVQAALSYQATDIYLSKLYHRSTIASSCHFNYITRSGYFVFLLFESWKEDTKYSSASNQPVVSAGCADS